MKRPEQIIQKALADHLRARAAAGTYWFHPANGGDSYSHRGRDPESLRRSSWDTDLILIKGGKTFGLELKAGNGRVGPAQQSAHEEMRAAGAEVAVAIGIDDALAQLERWQLRRGQTQ
jgi:hypothetical protein